MRKIENLTLHNVRGQKVLASALIDWRDPSTGSSIFGPVIKHSWSVDNQAFYLDREGVALWSLPDKSGLILIESDLRPDNSALLDVFGHERARLCVPWKMTGAADPVSGQPPTAFVSPSQPYADPKTGVEGEFGVIAWVQLAGRFYFELDYHTGQFLWCRQIRD